VSERKLFKIVIPNPPWRMRNLVTTQILDLQISLRHSADRNDTKLSFRTDTNYN
jgi:hypothetical protein